MSDTAVNHLAREQSPYLLQHAGNPVEWYPWGEEAFARARAENKPIFLSVGYSTCHWCHVMAHESFENSEIARVMNTHFINIKVDREERPDVDRLYMTFVQATTGHGGWPMSVWLTPELKPFVGGTYFPPVDVQGRTGFPTVLEKIAVAWRTQREQILAQGTSVVEALRQNVAGTTTASETTDGSEVEPPQSVEALGIEAMQRGYHIFARLFDGEDGGWGDAPKFPRPVVFHFLFREYARRGAHTSEGRHAAETALFTLRKMAAGGMHDHLGGGFHRYSVDAFWHVPHFEKMLYDQAQLACAHLEAFQLCGEKEHAAVTRDILGYVLRDLSSPLGGFYSAEDADSLVAAGQPEHAEGAFYVWTQAQIEAELEPCIAEIFAYTYGVEPEGNAPDGSDPQGEFKGKNILLQRFSVAQAAEKFQLDTKEVEQQLATAREKLLAVRAGRPRPHLDDKIITAWNGLMISAFARAHQVLGDAEYLQAAERAALFIQKNLTAADGTELLRSFRNQAGTVPGFADDYAFLIQGLLDLYEAGFDSQWLRWAVSLQEKMNELFWDDANGGYFGTSGRDASILLRLKEDYDGAEPSPNSIAALNLLRLAAMTSRAAWREQAAHIFRAFASQIKDSPIAVPQMLVAMDYFLSKPTQIVFAAPEGASLEPLLREVYGKFLPHKIVMLARDTETMRDAVSIDNKATAFVCIDFTCQLPVTDPAALSKQLCV